MAIIFFVCAILNINKDNIFYFQYDTYKIIFYYIGINLFLDIIDKIFKTRLSFRVDFIDRRLNLLCDSFYSMRLAKYHILPLHEYLIQKKQFKGSIHYHNQNLNDGFYFYSRKEKHKEYLKNCCINKTDLWRETYDVFRLQHNYLNYLFLSVISLFFIKMLSIVNNIFFV